MRLFIGLSLNPALRREAAAYAAFFQSTMPGKYALSSNYHITMAFLGEISEERLDEVKQVMSKAAKEAVSFPVSIRGAGYFGKREHAILHLVPQMERNMQRAAEILRRKLIASGIPFDPQPFNAHITLARNVRITDALALPTPPMAEGRANGLTLYHSTRVNDVLTYIPIDFAPFGA